MKETIYKYSCDVCMKEIGNTNSALYLSLSRGEDNDGPSEVSKVWFDLCEEHYSTIVDRVKQIREDFPFGGRPKA